jgi:hypothetical protein
MRPADLKDSLTNGPLRTEGLSTSLTAGAHCACAPMPAALMIGHHFSISAF